MIPGNLNIHTQHKLPQLLSLDCHLIELISIYRISKESPRTPRISEELQRISQLNVNWLWIWTIPTADETFDFTITISKEEIEY